MSVENDVGDLMELWHKTDERLKVSLANIWIDREEGKLEAIEIEAHKVESEALRILKQIHDKKDADDLHKHMKEFLSLIHHVKLAREWQKEVQEELNEICRDAIKAIREKTRLISIARQQAWKQRISSVPQSRIIVETTQRIKIDLEELKETYYKIGKYLDNGFWAIPTQNPPGNYLFAKEDMDAITDDLVFKCYPNLPPEALGQPFQFTFSFCEIKRLAWTSAGLEDKHAAGILSAQLIPGEVLITDAFRFWKRNEEEKKHRHMEMIPPQRSMQQLIGATDKKFWVWMGIGNLIAIPFPSQNPKSYYLVPRLSSSGPNRIHDAFDKIYDGLTRGDFWENYIIERPAWISARVLERASFDIWQIEATWEAEGEKGIARKIR